MEHLIELRDVYKIYPMGSEQVHALDGISLTIDRGEFVAIVGQSGSGKSTAMNIIGCLDVPTSGTYRLGGVDVSTMNDDQQAEIRNKMLGFIFQQYNLIPKLTVRENVELPLLYAGIGAEERRRRAEESLERVGLAGRSEIFPASSPAVSSSGCPSPGLWRVIPRSFWQTSPPARWTPGRAGRCWAFCKSSTRRVIRSFSSRMTTPSL